MTITPVKTRVFKEGEDLIAFILAHIPMLKEGSLLAVTSKIVALSERRTALIRNRHTKTRLIQKESDWAVRTKYAWLTVKSGDVMAAAGIDESNANGKLILLPQNCFRSARLLCARLQTQYKLKKIGIMITDSRIVPLRAGVMGAAVGYAGFKGIKDYRGKPDIFGRKLTMTQVNLADGLATAAVLLMGEGREQQPLAVIEKPPIVFTARVNPVELKIDPRDDLYRPLFARFP